MADEKKDEAESGWTRRDELAVMFMQGMLSADPREAGQGGAQQVALAAYRFADGFLAVRARGPAKK